MHPLLEVRNISYTYSDSNQFILRDIELALEARKILAIVGESGSGKSTLLQLIAGLLDPQEGVIYLNGEKVTGPAANLVPGHPDIKVIFQHFGLSPKINVYQNIAYLLKSYPLPYREERVKELLSFCKLTGKEENMPHELSGGEKQRLAMARALADDPQLLLMDEPFSNMDIILKNQLKEDLIDILQDTHTTAIIVSHDMHDALSVADQIAVMQQGKLVQTGTPAFVYEKPATPYVAQLFGTCNFMNSKQATAILAKSIHDHQTICIRAEYIHLVQQAHSTCTATIIRKHFMGAYHELIVKVNEWLLVVFMYTDVSHLQVGDQVCLSIEEEKLIYFD